MNQASATVNAYTRVNVETASQGKLVVMLFDGAIRRAQEAARLLETGGRRDEIHKNLVHAQDILAELRNALDMRRGEIARNLDRIYEYFQHLLITANLRKETAPVEECVRLMREMRDTWDEAFKKVSRENAELSAGVANHRTAVVNMTALNLST